jgi:hypothetical protein
MGILGRAMPNDALIQLLMQSLYNTLSGGLRPRKTPRIARIITGYKKPFISNSTGVNQRGSGIKRAVYTSYLHTDQDPGYPYAMKG